VPVTIFGTITDPDPACTIESAKYAVKDEYGKVQPSGPVTLDSVGAYRFTVLLEASRFGTDPDGRLYTITVGALKHGGKKGSGTARVIVPHDHRR